MTCQGWHCMWQGLPVQHQSSYRVSASGEWGEVGHLGTMCKSTGEESKWRWGSSSSLSQHFPAGHIRLWCKQGDFERRSHLRRYTWKLTGVCRGKDSPSHLTLKRAWVGGRVVAFLCLWNIVLIGYQLSESFTLHASNLRFFRSQSLGSALAELI